MSMLRVVHAINHSTLSSYIGATGSNDVAYDTESPAVASRSSKNNSIVEQIITAVDKKKICTSMSSLRRYTVRRDRHPSHSTL